MKWHDDPRFWQDFAPLVMFGEARFGRALIEAKLVSLLVAPSASILDMCCGLGWHSIELAKLGFRVTGVDITKTYIEAARSQAAEHHVSVEFLEGDMRTFRRPAVYDAIASLSTSFGFFEDESDDIRVAVNFRESLKLGGTLLMDMVRKEVLRSTFVEKDCREMGDITVTVERSASKNWTWIEERWIVSRAGSAKEYRMAYRPYSARELVRLLLRAGFISVQTFGDLSCAPYNRNATRLVVRAESPS